ncbi:Sodium- and chloride-dependent GABA transporter 1 [Stylophora pistillata]|uniref:Sodium-and chloride-dependent GABA transporter 1 n=1 Tax=Stylophora pistillata TaxID=50429 RepID=A0A2B4RTN8_STYPI|nr:Sodium- and chloride-dependent GABA transporter 1 [Stylophora pistillata]
MSGIEKYRRGHGLGFVAYPEGIAQMPAAPVWAVMFFMLFTIGLGSQGGIYVLNIFDSQSGGFSLICVVALEAVAVSWGYDMMRGNPATTSSSAGIGSTSLLLLQR